MIEGTILRPLAAFAAAAPKLAIEMKHQIADIHEQLEVLNKTLLSHEMQIFAGSLFVPDEDYLFHNYFVDSLGHYSDSAAFLNLYTPSKQAAITLCAIIAIKFPGVQVTANNLFSVILKTELPMESITLNGTIIPSYSVILAKVMNHRQVIY